MARKYSHRPLGLALLSCFVLAGARIASATVNIAMVPVGDAGNKADISAYGGYGAVSYAYNIGKYDVTAAQYTAFLNAVARTGDPYGLYNPYMATQNFGCGIAISGTAGNLAYSTTKNGNFPVNYVSWDDAARFCNWLSNGQPNLPEGPGTTETSSYTLSGSSGGTAITRNAGATYVIPKEDEWYKAAYYKGGGTVAGYWLYPTQSDTFPSNVFSVTGSNNANFWNGGYTDAFYGLTAVGAFAASPGPYGTFDQGGDVFQWDEASISGKFVLCYY